MFERISIRYIANAHIKGLTRRNYDAGDPEIKPDWVARIFLFGTPLLLAIAMALSGAQLAAPASVLTLFGLLSAALFMAFTRVTGWRDVLTSREPEFDQVDLPRRDALDEVVAHILVALYAALTTALVITVGLNVSPIAPACVAIAFSAVTVFFASWTFALLLVIIPTLYSAYDKVAKVRPHMSGNVFGRYQDRR